MSRRGRKSGGGGGHEESGTERWLVPYADMLTLLLAVFIVLFSMASVDPARYDELRQTLADRFGGQVLDGGAGIAASSSNPLDPSLASRLVESNAQQPVRFSPSEQQRLNRLRADAEQVLRNAGIQGEVQVVSERGVVIRMSNRSLFDSGSAELRPAARRALTTVAARLEPMRRHVAVEGHTDGVPINTARYPSNWELSTARAVNVGRFLIDQGIAPRRMQMSGFADTRPLVRPRFPTQSVDRNRRVEIVIKSSAAAARDGSEVATPRAADGPRDAPADRGVPAELIPYEDVIGPIVDVGGGR